MDRTARRAQACCAGRGVATFAAPKNAGRWEPQRLRSPGPMCGPGLYRDRGETAEVWALCAHPRGGGRYRGDRFTPIHSTCGSRPRRGDGIQDRQSQPYLRRSRTSPAGATTTASSRRGFAGARNGMAPSYALYCRDRVRDDDTGGVAATDHGHRGHPHDARPGRRAGVVFEHGDVRVPARVRAVLPAEREQLPWQHVLRALVTKGRRQSAGSSRRVRGWGHGVGSVSGARWAGPARVRNYRTIVTTYFRDNVERLY